MNHYKNLKFHPARIGAWIALKQSIFANLSRGDRIPHGGRYERTADAEIRQAGTFAFLRYKLSNDETLEFATVPSQDHYADVVLRSASGADKTLIHEEVQLKELVPAELSKTQTLESLLDSILNRYGPGARLNIAININRVAITILGSIAAPAGSENCTFWLFGINDRGLAYIVSDPFSAFNVSEFPIPRAPSLMTEW